MFFYTVVVSVDCLSVVLKDIEDIKPLGLLLGIQEGTLEAIQTYYGVDERALTSKHILNLWLINDPKDPARQLRDALNELTEFEISQQLLLLTSIGN